MLGLGNIDCYVRLDILSDEQIAVLCRPPKVIEPVNQPIAPVNQPIAPVNQPNAPANQLIPPVNQSIAFDVPEPASFVEVFDENYYGTYYNNSSLNFKNSFVAFVSLFISYPYT